MDRTLALSNLTLLPHSLLKGPEKSWEIAREAGFNSLKVNPLRGWGAATLQELHIPVLSFEAPWRTSFPASVQNLVQHRDLSGFAVDVICFGYQGADERARSYGMIPGIIGVDCPASYAGNFLRVRETEYKDDKWPDPLGGSELASLDTWHVRDYPRHWETLQSLRDSDRIRHVDIQTRDFKELMRFLRKERTLLCHQLKELRSLPLEVGFSLELYPHDLIHACSSFSLSYGEVLRKLQLRIREILE